MGRELDRPAGDRDEAPDGGRGAATAALTPQAQVLRLQRTAGNRAVGRLLVQRNGKGKVNIVDPAKASGWYAKTGMAWNDYDAWIRDFVVVQECMMNPKLYRPALRALEEAVFKERRRDREPIDDDAPLERVLLKKEREHGINLEGAPIYTRTLSALVFSEMSQQSVVATDPGAGARHGAYTHRIQWWVVLLNADKLKHKPADLVKKAIDPQFTPPAANWPQEAEVEGLGKVPLPENRFALWDALFDRTVPQSYAELFNLNELGISHPELFTGEIVKGSFPELDEVAEIIRAQVGRNWGGGGSATDAVKTEAALTSPAYRQHREGVYFRVPA